MEQQVNKVRSITTNIKVWQWKTDIDPKQKNLHFWPNYLRVVYVMMVVGDVNAKTFWYVQHLLAVVLLADSINSLENMRVLQNLLLPVYLNNFASI